MARRRKPKRAGWSIDSGRPLLPKNLGRALGIGLLLATANGWAQEPTDEDLILPPVDVRSQRRLGEYRLLKSDLFKVPSELADYPLVELEGKQRVDGFEISAAGEILKGWQIFTGYTYLNPKIVEAVDVQNGVPIQGNYLPHVPQSSATLWTTYNFTWHWPIQFGGGAIYASKRYANASNLVSSPSYLTGDLTAAVRPLPNLELRMNVQNISNEFYFQQLHPGHFVPAAGRTFLFTATMSY